MLKKKMIRDIKNNLSQFVTIFLMISIGIMAYVGINAYMGGMQKTSDTFYKENNLQDLNVIGTSFSQKEIDKIKAIDNVKDAEGKLSVIGTTNNDKTLLLNFIESNNISKFYIISGTSFDNTSGVWLDNFYAKENNLKVGDTITVKYDGIELQEEIKGLINVPDHVYDVKDEAELYPNHKDFGFAYLSINEIPENYITNQIMQKYNIKKIKDLKKYIKNYNYKDYLVYNYIMVDIENNEKREEVKNEIENQINPLAVINIEDTTSYRTYQGEIDEGKTYVGVFSGLFLFIALLSVITTMTRLVKNERIQIGTLKALGFKNSKIIMHYTEYGLFISIIASIFGIILGYFLIGKVFINMEMNFFEIPNGKPIITLNDFIVSLIVILLVALITYLTSISILKESPAESLRVKMPKVKKKELNITTKGIFKYLNFSSKWNLRDILRNKIRTLMGIVGVSGCTMLIVCAFGMLNSMNHFIKLQFRDLYNFDYKLSLKENVNIDELSKKYGTSTSMTIGIEILKDDKKETNNIFVDDSNNNIRFVNKKNKFIKIDSTDGVYITYKLAQTNNYKIGDTIKWHMYGSDKYYESKIVGFNKDPQNQNVTMNRKYLESLGITYKPDSLYTNSDLSNTKEIEGVNLIQDRSNLEEGMQSMLGIMKKMIVLIIAIAIILGSVIIYNLGILSLNEKMYQFATLKVLGFTDSKIKKIFIKQNNWIALISIIIGLPLGYYLAEFLFKVAIEEHYDFSAHIEYYTYILAGIITFVVSYIVSKILAKKINNIDMVSSLKGNE